MIWSKSAGYARGGTKLTYTFENTGFFQTTNTIQNVGSVSADSSSDGKWHSYWGRQIAYLYLYDADGNKVLEILNQNDYGTLGERTSETFYAEPGWYLYGEVVSSSTNAAWNNDDSSWKCSLTGYVFSE